MARERPVTAAGAVVWRRRATTPDTSDAGRRPVELLLVHRPGYDDWTFPKGKPDPGEDLAVTAVREVAEETGQLIRLGHPLPPTSYHVAAGSKHVSYWTGRVVRATDPPFAPNDEVDEVRWVRPRDARRLLTYRHDLDLLEAFLDLREERRHRARVLILLRHGEAVPRDAWPGPDVERTLTEAGAERAAGVVPLLAAYGVRRLVTSPATRCTATLEPYADHLGGFLELDERLGEAARRSDVERSVGALLATKTPTAVCSHRPTLSRVLDALGVPRVELTPGEGLVVHHRKGVVHAVEPLGDRATTLP